MPFLPNEASFRYRWYNRDGLDYAIKLTGDYESMAISHGYNFEDYEKLIQAFVEAENSGIINPQKYDLQGIKVLGKFVSKKEEYLVVMERIETKSYSDYETGFNDTENRFAAAWELAKEEFFKDMETLSKTYDGIMPDPRHVFSIQHTKPESLEKGKWIITLPVDVT